MSGQTAAANPSRSGASDRTGEGRRLSRKHLVVISILGVAILVWLVLFLTVGGDFYLTVEEAQAAGPQENIRVGGVVSPGSISQESAMVRFVLEGDAGGKLEVAYSGQFPERLATLEEVVVSGSLDGSGPFQATEVLVKCPSKLFPEKATNGLLGAAGFESLLY